MLHSTAAATAGTHAVPFVQVHQHAVELVKNTPGQTPAALCANPTHAPAMPATKDASTGEPVLMARAR